MTSARLLSISLAVPAPLIWQATRRRDPAIFNRSPASSRAFPLARQHSLSRGVVSMSASGRAGAVKETLGTEAYANLAGKQVRTRSKSSPAAPLVLEPDRALKACLLQVYLVSTQEPLDITSLWGQDDRAVLVFGRSMGVSADTLWPACVVSSAS